jgi:beta-glucosidase
MVTDEGNPIVAAGDYAVSIGGGRPDTGAPTASGHFHIDSQLVLTE